MDPILGQPEFLSSDYKGLGNWHIYYLELYLVQRTCIELYTHKFSSRLKAARGQVSRLK